MYTQTEYLMFVSLHICNLHCRSFPIYLSFLKFFPFVSLVGWVFQGRLYPSGKVSVDMSHLVSVSSLGRSFHASIQLTIGFSLSSDFVFIKYFLDFNLLRVGVIPYITCLSSFICFSFYFTCYFSSYFGWRYYAQDLYFITRSWFLNILLLIL